MIAEVDVQLTTGVQRIRAGTTAHAYLMLIAQAIFAEPTILADSTENHTTGVIRRTAAGITAVWLSHG